MSIELVAWIGVVGWVHFWIEYRFGRWWQKQATKASDGWKKSLDEQEKLIHICKMQSRLLENHEDDGEGWKK